MRVGLAVRLGSATGIATTLSAATGLTYAQAFDDLTDGMQDTPTLQVYWEDMAQDPSTSNDRTSFRAGVRQTSITIFADLYAHQRAHMAEDMAILMPLVDAIRVELEKQDTQPLVGTSLIKSFSWSARRVTFTYGDPNINYIAARFTLTVRVF
jgi:hypothetical protein